MSASGDSSGPGVLHRLDDGQMRAAAPDANVWLGASAGTGKTQVLSARVLRLLLAGTAPDAILCITFTKAGAAEMAHRIGQRLARWVRADDRELRVDLEALGLDWQDRALRDRARALFATVIDSPLGAIRVQTIHSFCQALLGAFPLEADLLPGFELIESESAVRDLLRRTLAELLSDSGAEAEANRAAAAMLGLRLGGEDKALTFLARCVAPFDAVLPPAPHDVRALLGLPPGPPDEWIAVTLAAGVIDDGDIAAVAAAAQGWKSKTSDGIIDLLGRWGAADGPARAAMLGDLSALFLTKEGKMRAHFVGEKGSLRSVQDAAERLVERIDGVLGTAAAMALADDLAQGWTLGARLAERFALAKRREGVADFDDLIRITGALLRTRDFADWIRFKLDQRTDHILVDEAQDTNGAQWAIVDVLAEDFFAGAGAKDDRVRTLFSVGDRKQSIMSFQGTDPAAFERARAAFADKAEGAGRTLHDIDLVRNYRSSPTVLAVVDAWLAAGRATRLGIEADVPPHIPARAEMPGRVELWQPLAVGNAAETNGDDESSEEGEVGEASALAPASDPASVRLARAIGDTVARWIAEGIEGRAVQPGDILILVRRRRDLAARIVARLQAMDVAVAGVDRFALTQPLAVRDLMAAMRFAVQPLDDLNLAALLVSPLIGWTQDQLYERIHARGRTPLWAHLRATEEALPAADMAALRSLLAMADYETPHRFLEQLLSGPVGGRRRLLARLGQEAADAIEELLTQALAFEARELPSLQGFLGWLDARTIEVKRQQDARGNVVRVMTVHGSKGLQAPIVILADATDDPDRSDVAATIDLAGWSGLPLFRTRKGQAVGRLAAAQEAARAAALEEHWRLLYVGLTRAERMLVVTGTCSSAEGKLPGNCWYSAVEQVLTAMGAAWEDAPAPWGRRMVHAQRVRQWASERRHDKASAALPAQPLPAWVDAAAPEESRPPRPLAPSALGADDAGRPALGRDRAAAIARGVWLHSLFERLPANAPKDRRAAAERWLAGQPDAPDAATRRAMIDEVLAVLDAPEWATLFGPDALAEAPFSAVVDGLVVAGIVDRLLVTDDSVLVIDFKTGHHVPADAAAVAPAYLRQMAAYAAALRAIFPGRDVRAALLYTAAPRLIALPDALLAAHGPGAIDTPPA